MQTLREKLTPDAIQVGYLAIDLDNFASRIVDQNQAKAMLKMSAAEFASETRGGNVAMQNMWMVMDVTNDNSAALSDQTLTFEPTIHSATPSPELETELAQELEYSRERLKEDTLWYEHEDLANLHASLASEGASETKAHHTRAANAHYMAFKAADACANAETDGTQDLLAAFVSYLAMIVSIEINPSFDTGVMGRIISLAVTRCLEKTAH